MPKVLILKGLPASGKSTYAKELVGKGGSDSQWKRVNKDDLRAMLDNSKWSKSNETQIIAVRDMLIRHFLELGNNVVVDDTNLHPKHYDAVKAIATELGATVETKFFDVPVDECIKRDLQRPVSVGEQVIRRMYRDFLAPKYDAPLWNYALPTVIICDLDGTLAHMNGRGPYDTTGYLNDKEDPVIAEILTRFLDSYKPVFLSGRSADYRAETQGWLDRRSWGGHPLFMRPSGDTGKDSIVKRELYEQHIAGHYNVKFVLDDRNQVIDMWRSLGLKCLQVAPGDF